ncbi:MAG: creatininase family protein [Nanoarchaeota archaeon]|nr:creatininase family protein [Nanoarchaeota archaeon]MCG2718303.1 creatininase family protein [Nanoarchaeota archaeon]
MVNYEELTWEEIRDIDKDRVVILPIATIEDHGPHLPVNTDGIITKVLCEKLAESMPDETILLPIVTYGYSPHHEDFPGSLNIGYDTLIRYVVDIGKDLAKHGFKRLLIVNGHGSNGAPVEIAHKRINYETDGKILCASCFYLSGDKSVKAISKVRKSKFPGGMGHACELETSLMLVVRPDLVKMDKARKDMNYPEDTDLFMDWSDGALSFMPFWSTISETGTAGDPTVATKKTGDFLLKVAVDELCERVKILRRLDYNKYSKRVDHHS